MSRVYGEEALEIKRGDIFMVDLSPGLSSEYQGIRPCLVIQNNFGNKHSTTITIIPLTSVSKRSLPTHIRIGAGEFGLEKDSTICAEGIRTVDKMRFRQKLGSVDANTLLKIENAILINLGMFT